MGARTTFSVLRAKKKQLAMSAAFSEFAREIGLSHPRFEPYDPNYRCICSALSPNC
jgi:hypothetical protein